MAIGHAAGTAAALLSAGPRLAGPHPAGSYQRHRPEHTLLYQIIAQHYPTFRDLMEAQGGDLPVYVKREFDDYLKCGRLEHGFLRVRCDSCHVEHLTEGGPVAFSCKRGGVHIRPSASGFVRLILYFMARFFQDAALISLGEKDVIQPWFGPLGSNEV